MRHHCRYPVALSLIVLSLIAANAVPTKPPPVFVAKWGSQGSLTAEFEEPRGVAVDVSGNVYVADTLNDRVQKFDRNGTFLSVWGWGVDTGADMYEICTIDCQAGIAGSGNGQFSNPYGVATDASGNVYVGDTFNQRVQKFDGNGTFLTKWGTVGTSGTHFNSPRGVAVGVSGNVYVADTLNHRISVFSASGAFVRTWGWGVLGGTPQLRTCAFAPLCQAGIAGSGDGQLNAPDGIAVDAFGNVYVADSSNDRIQKFDTNGAFLIKWGSTGTGDGQFTAPSAVAADASGDVYAGGGALWRIQIFDSNGTFLTKFGTSGTGDGQFLGARDLAVGATGDIFVADKGHHRIQKFGGPWLEVFIGEVELPSRWRQEGGGR